MTWDVTTSRELFVPPELVFEVWTGREHLEGWYVAAAAELRGLTVEARPGGDWSVRWRDQDGDWEEAGSFLGEAGPRHWRCRLALRGPSGEAPETELAVTLVGTNGACRIELAHRGLPDAQWQELWTRRWQARLERLEAYFSAI